MTELNAAIEILAEKGCPVWFRGESACPQKIHVPSCTIDSDEGVYRCWSLYLKKQAERK